MEIQRPEVFTTPEIGHNLEATIAHLPKEALGGVKKVFEKIRSLAE